MNSEAEDLILRFSSETDPFIKAKILKSLISGHQLRIKDLSVKLKLKPSYLCHFLRLNRLPEIVVDGFYAKNISLSHLFVISRLKDGAKLLELYERVLANSLTVLQTEELVREILYGVKTEGEMLTEEEKADYYNQLDKGVRMKIVQTRVKSKLSFEVSGSLVKTTKILKNLLNRLKKNQSQ